MPARKNNDEEPWEFGNCRDQNEKRDDTGKRIEVHTKKCDEEKNGAVFS